MSCETSRSRRLLTPADIGLVRGARRGGRSGQDLAVEVGDGMGLVGSENAAGGLSGVRGLRDGVVVGWFGVRL